MKADPGHTHYTNVNPVYRVYDYVSLRSYFSKGNSAQVDIMSHKKDTIMTRGNDPCT